MRGTLKHNRSVPSSDQSCKTLLLSSIEMSQKQVRKRGANYTQEEKSLLLELVMQYKHIVENKKTGGNVIQRKKEAWHSITMKYNSSCSSGLRDIDQLKSLYDNLKQKSRKDVGESNKLAYIQAMQGTVVTEEDVNKALNNIKEDKIQINKTGGGFWKPKMTDNDAKVLAIIQEQIEPLHNPFDSASDFFKDKIDGTMTDSMDIIVSTQEQLPEYTNFVQEVQPLQPTLNVETPEKFILVGENIQEKKRAMELQLPTPKRICMNTPAQNKLPHQKKEARHSMSRRDANDDDIFAADEASVDDGTQNDDFYDTNQEAQDEPDAIEAVITTKPRTYEVKVGNQVTLECKVDPDNGTVVQWLKDNVVIFVSAYSVDGEKYKRYSISPVSKDLIIREVEPSDSGVFRCEVVQAKNTVQVEHSLVVLESPRIIRFTATNNGNVVEDENLLLTCDTRGMPPAQIVWSRAGENGNERLGEKDGEFTSNSFFIKGVKREYSGQYYCYAFNSIGHHQAELRVNVAGKPRVHVHRTVVNSAINVEAVLQCTAHNEANPHIRWYKDGQPIEDSSQYDISTNGAHSNLSVTPTTSAAFGTYTCEAENGIGKHNRSIELVQKPVVESLGADGGRLSWTVHSHQPLQEITAQIHLLGDGEDTWKEFQIPLPSAQNHKYEIIYDLHDKVDNGKYEAFVKVKNDHSWSDGVDPVILDIEIEPELIQHASVYRGNSYSIRPSSIALSTIMMYVLVRLL